MSLELGSIWGTVVVTACAAAVSWEMACGDELGFADVVTPQSIAMLEDYVRAKIPLDALGDKVAWRDQSIIALRLFGKAYVVDNALFGMYFKLQVAVHYF